MSVSTSTVRDQLRAADTEDWHQIFDCWWSTTLRPLACEDLKSVVDAFPYARRWQARSALIHYCTGFSKTYQEPIDLAVHALSDRSGEVRYRACGLLAYSGNRLVLPHLREAAKSSSESFRPVAAAAIQSIEEQTIEPFLTLDSPKRQFHFLPIPLPRRMWNPTFAEEFHAVAGKWLSELNFEPQSIFQHDAFYRRRDMWFHAYWDQYDVVWCFMLGHREQLSKSYVHVELPGFTEGGTISQVSERLRHHIKAQVNRYG